jgi:hypothetical protein
MARILIDLDTKTNSMKVSLNGNLINNITDISIYVYDPDYDGYDGDGDEMINCGISTVQTNDDVKTVTRIMTSSSPEAQAALADGSGTVLKTNPELVVAKHNKYKNGNPKATREIQEYFGLGV